MEHMAEIDCRHFNGYKPCGMSVNCTPSCSQRDLVKNRILLIHLGALGAVVRSTALLPAIRRKFPQAHITWVTDRPGDQLLRKHPLVDRVLVNDHSGLLALKAMAFDAALVVDKNAEATGILASTRADLVFGFVAADSGAVLPATEAARELWEIGLSDHLKFNVNRKPETRLVHEALELGPWQRDRYSLFLDDLELAESERRRVAWGAGRFILGVNTGCAPTLPAKKLSLQGHIALISRILKRSSSPAVVLLGGKEDTDRNRAIGLGVFEKTGVSIVESPTDRGLRDGLISVSACHAVVTGDSLGMHMAIALDVPVVAWFGPTCDHEIDIYDRGVKIRTLATCSPCWQRNCAKMAAGEQMCFDQIEWTQMVESVYSLLSDCHPSNRISGRYVAVDPAGESAAGRGA